MIWCPIASARTPISLVFIGDSTTLGAGVPSAERWFNSYPGQVRTQINPHIGFNAGDGGERCDELLSISNVRADGVLDLPNYQAPGYVFLWCGINDLAQDPATTAADIYAIYTQWVSDRQAAGWDNIVVMTLPPFVGGSLTAAENAAVDSTRAQLNSLIMANAAQATDVIDLASIPQLADPSDTTYRPDGVHYTALGYSLIADAIVSFLP